MEIKGTALIRCDSGAGDTLSLRLDPTAVVVDRALLFVARSVRSGVEKSSTTIFVSIDDARELSRLINTLIDGYDSAKHMPAGEEKANG